MRPTLKVGGSTAVISSKIMTQRNQQQHQATNNAISHHLAIAIAIAVATTSITFSSIVLCAEEDVHILMPLANLAKAIINTATTGAPLQLDLNASDLIKSFASLTWRYGFPVTMPSDFMNRTQEFYERVRVRVEAADVKLVPRKSLASLKIDLDEIVDAIIEEVRRSPDGVYTDYEKTMVNGETLEDASVRIGIQFKAYGIDIKNYRNIAGMILGIPLMPTVANTVMTAADIARPGINMVANITSNIAQSLPMNQLPGETLKTISQFSNSAANQVSSLKIPTSLADVTNNIPSSFNWLLSG